MIQAIRFFVIFFFLPFIAIAQDEITPPTDDTYISNYSHTLVLRLLGSRKINDYQIGQKGKKHEAEYSPNDITGVGLGFNYGSFGLNITFGIPLLNNDDDVYGKTKGLDLASYIYRPTFAIDVLAKVYKGHYLSDNDLISSRPVVAPYALRPDMESQFYSLNGQYIFNDKRFSYRASFVQNEWQRKSAGSFLVGINLNHTRVKGDSAILPPEFTAPGASPILFDKTSISSVGVNGGYAHTFVYREHWFATLALTLGIGGNNTSFSENTTGTSESSFGLHLNGTARAAAGYNSEKWYAGVYYVNFANRNFARLNNADLWQQTENGIYRIVVARRITLRKK
ncbi:MAG TPA: DUF4421 domain-containing protein [Flavipsychrobacter sp.]|nr:DUF4421 domain-containing protein [Flavipsychrobacter sp.]